MERNIRNGLIVGILSALAFGTLGSLVNVLGNFKMNPYTLTVLVPIVLAIYFGIYLWVKDKSAFKVSWQMLVLMAIVGFIGLDGQNFCIIKAYDVLPFGVVSALLFTNTFLTMVGSRFLFGNKITWLKGGAGLVCLVGVCLVLDFITLCATGKFSFQQPIALLWCLGAIITIAATYVAFKYIMEVGKVDYLSMMFWVDLFAVILFWITVESPGAMLGDCVSVVNTGGLLPLLGYILIPTILSFHLWALSIKMVDPTWTAIAYAFDPVTETVCGLIFFGQMMKGVQYLGILIVIAAVCFVSYQDWKEGQLKQKPSLTA
jgi:O-acetylserine/cysteine efflux transporter